MFYVMPLQFRGHLDGLFEGYVSVLVAVEQHRWCVVAIFRGAVRIESARFLIRIVSDYFLRPKPVVGSKEKHPRIILTAGIPKSDVAYRAVGLRFGTGGCRL